MGRRKKKTHIVAIPSFSLIINCILLGALPCTLGEHVSNTFPSSPALAKGVLASWFWNPLLGTWRKSDQRKEGEEEKITGRQRAGVRLWAGACKSELPPWTERVGVVSSAVVTSW